MGIFELLLIGVGLSMDAFAAAVCKGLSMRKIHYGRAAVIGGFFGGFQAAMPLIGWFLGKQFQSYITNFDHWVAFLLLAFIGIKMIVEAVRSGPDAPAVQEDRLQIRELVILALATSIDALAVGITFAFLQINIWAAISIIGITTFILSFLGVMVGNRFGARYKQKAEIAGGVILVLIGLKILLEHLGLLPF